MPPVIETWTETIDRLMYAAHARVCEVWKGYIFVGSTFVLMPHSTHRSRGRMAARDRLNDQLVRRELVSGGCDHHNGMPLIGRVRDINRR